MLAVIISGILRTNGGINEPTNKPTNQRTQRIAIPAGIGNKLNKKSCTIQSQYYNISI